MECNRVNQTYKTQGASVYGNGKRFNVTNNVTATELCNTLNKLTDTINLYENTTNQFDKITRQLIQVQMSIKILDDEVTRLTEMITNESSNR